MSNRGTEQAAAAKSILRGTFESFSLADVVGALALSRQLLGVHFSDEKRQVGSILVKAGQVVSAEDFRIPCRGAAAFDGLMSNPGTAFSVVRVPRAALETQVVIGKLGDLLASAVGGRSRAPTAATESRAPSASAEFFFPNDTFDPPESLSEAPISAPSGEHDSVPGAESGIDSSRSSSDGVASPRIDEVIMLGNVGDASFDEILEVLQLSDQQLLISFSRGDSEVGALRLMSGQVLAATAGPALGMEAFRKLHADHGDVFEVRRLTGPGVTKGLGGVTELLADMRQVNPPVTPGSKPPGRRTLFMRGELSDFPLEVLIGSLDLSRQSIELELRRGDQVLHRVMVRAGRITSVASVRGEGTDAALAAIREDPGTQFLVYRNTDSGVGQSVASLEAAGLRHRRDSGFGRRIFGRTGRPGSGSVGVRAQRGRCRTSRSLRHRGAARTDERRHCGLAGRVEKSRTRFRPTRLGAGNVQNRDCRGKTAARSGGRGGHAHRRGAATSRRTCRCRPRTARTVRAEMHTGVATRHAGRGGRRAHCCALSPHASPIRAVGPRRKRGRARRFRLAIRHQARTPVDSERSMTCGNGVSRREWRFRCHWGLNFRSDSVQHEPGRSRQCAPNTDRSIAGNGADSRQACGMSPAIEFRHR